MQVTKVHVSGRSGANGQPASGWAYFDDGKAYSFGPRIERDDTDGVYRAVGFFFSGTRSVAGGYTTESFNFNSPKREAALIAHFNG
jgi:hypothetical protein